VMVACSSGPSRPMYSPISTTTAKVARRGVIHGRGRRSDAALARPEAISRVEITEAAA